MLASSFELALMQWVDGMRALRLLRGGARGAPFLPRSLACCAEAIETETVPAAPGTVNEYHHHILVRLPPKARSSQPKEPGTLWPSLVEREPAVLQVFRALAKHRSATGEDVKTKVTAYDDVNPLPGRDPELCDLIALPAGLKYTALPLSHVQAVVAHALADASTPPLPWAAIACQSEVTDRLQLFVCCHGTRDGRCGQLGPPLAQALLRAVKQQSLQEHISVLQTSHVGGHKFAGNVVVYGAMHPADGDWFGALRAENAEEFVDALAQMEIGVDGGAGDARLRRWWRGRMGLSKEEQVELFQEGGQILEDSMDSADEEEEDDEEAECRELPDKG